MRHSWNKIQLFVLWIYLKAVCGSCVNLQDVFEYTYNFTPYKKMYEYSCRCHYMEKCADTYRVALTMRLTSYACWSMLVPTSMLVIRRCGHHCMPLLHVAIWGCAAISANSQFPLFFAFFVYCHRYCICSLSGLSDWILADDLMFLKTHSFGSDFSDKP